jgi:hypothetical protein
MENLVCFKNLCERDKIRGIIELFPLINSVIYSLQRAYNLQRWVLLYQKHLISIMSSIRSINTGCKKSPPSYLIFLLMEIRLLYSGNVREIRFGKFHIQTEAKRNEIEPSSYDDVGFSYPRYIFTGMPTLNSQDLR